MGKQTDLILLDFSKVFDKVAYKKLISKLHFYGIRGKTLSWGKDFLDSLSQAVVLNGVKSESESESELLLVTRSNDNHSPGPVMREVSP